MLLLPHCGLLVLCSLLRPSAHQLKRIVSRNGDNWWQVGSDRGGGENRWPATAVGRARGSVYIKMRRRPKPLNWIILIESAAGHDAVNIEKVRSWVGDELRELGFVNTLKGREFIPFFFGSKVLYRFSSWCSPFDRHRLVFFPSALFLCLSLMNFYTSPSALSIFIKTLHTHIYI